MKTNMQKRLASFMKLRKLQTKTLFSNGPDIYISIKDINHANQWKILLTRLGLTNFDNHHNLTETIKMYCCQGQLPIAMIVHSGISQDEFMIVNFEPSEGHKVIDLI